MTDEPAAPAATTDAAGVTAPDGTGDVAAAAEVLRSRHWWRGLAVGIVVAGVAAGLVVSLSGGIASMLEAIAAVNPLWVLAAAAAEVVAYLVLAAQVRGLPRESHLSRRAALRAVLLAYGLGNLLPGAPAPGIILAFRDLHRHGLSDRQAHLTMGMSGWMFFRSLFLLTAVDVFVTLALARDVIEPVLLAVLAVATLAALAVSAVVVNRAESAQRAAVLFTRLRFWRPRPDRATENETAAQWHADLMRTVGAPLRRVPLIALSCSYWLADAASLYLALRGAHASRPFDVVFLAYVAGLLAQSIPFLPGGLGAVELVVPAVLHHFGVPLADALAGTLVWRMLSLFLPAIAGGVVFATIPLAGRAKSQVVAGSGG